VLANYGWLFGVLNLETEPEAFTDECDVVEGITLVAGMFNLDGFEVLGHGAC
jgi:hypothetical protein